MQTLAYRFHLTTDGLDVRLLADGREVGSTIVTWKEAVSLMPMYADRFPEDAVATAYEIRGQLLPPGWPPEWLSLATMTREIRNAWGQLRVRTPGDAGTLPP